MLDWLRRDPRATPSLDVGGRALPIQIRRLDRARRMTMRLAPDGSAIRISMPRWGHTAEALTFAASRREWLASQLQSLPVAEAIATGTVLPYRGHAVTLRHDPAATRKPLLKGTDLIVGGPEAQLAARLNRWLRHEALARCTEDLAEYCAKAQRATPRLALSNAGRRWGSCAASGTIRINWRLIMAPDPVRRSVIAHEVAHLVHFDHSPAFHACLDRLFEGDLDQANAWLKREGRGLYQLFG